MRLTEEKEEFDNFLRVKPDVMQTMLLFKIYKKMDKLTGIYNKLDKLTAFNSFMGPMSRRFKEEQQYQFATIPAPHGHGRVWYMVNPQPDLLVGIITQVANSWFPNTHLDWLIDHDPKRVEYIIGAVNAPKHFDRGVPFFDEVEWIAWNDDAVDHVFQVLCDGFFIDKKLYNKIAGGNNV